VKETSQWNNAKEGLDAEQSNCQQLMASFAELDDEKLAQHVEKATRQHEAATAELAK